MAIRYSTMPRWWLCAGSMERENVLPVLYDLVVTIGSEISVKPLLTRTLQRLLYHTSFSAGFICLEVPPCDQTDDQVEVRIDAAVGDFDLIGKVGTAMNLPRALICRTAARESDQAALLSALRCTKTQYKSYLRLPIDKFRRDHSACRRETENDPAADYDAATGAGALGQGYRAMPQQ